MPDRYYKAAEVVLTTGSPGMFDDIGRERLKYAIAAALFDETERCAQAAEKWADSQDRIALEKEPDAPASAQSHVESAFIGRRIAAAIRGVELAPADFLELLAQKMESRLAGMSPLERERLDRAFDRLATVLQGSAPKGKAE